MGEGLLSLKWNNHMSTFKNVLSHLRHKDTYADATLACEGKFFPVHKLVLSTCSDYFSQVFTVTSCKSPVVILKGIKSKDLTHLLDYMYRGEVDVRQDELADLVKAAECLEVKGLTVLDEEQNRQKHKKSDSFKDISPPAKKQRTDYKISNAPKDSADHSSDNFIPSRAQSPIDSDFIKFEDDDDKESVDMDNIYSGSQNNQDFKTETDFPSDIKVDPEEQGSSSLSGLDAMQEGNSWGDVEDSFSASNNDSFQQPSVDVTSLRHNPLDNSGRGKFQCSRCSIYFRSRANLNRHFAKHGDTKNFACDSCNYRTYRKDLLQSHKLKHMPH